VKRVSKYLVNKFQKKTRQLSSFSGQKGFTHATDNGYYGRGTYFSVRIYIKKRHIKVFIKGISGIFNGLYTRRHEIVTMSNITRKSTEQIKAEI
jgi:hypothetical protein